MSDEPLELSLYCIKRASYSPSPPLPQLANHSHSKHQLPHPKAFATPDPSARPATQAYRSTSLSVLLRELLQSGHEERPTAVTTVVLSRDTRCCGGKKCWRRKSWCCFKSVTVGEQARCRCHLFSPHEPYDAGCWLTPRVGLLAVCQEALRRRCHDVYSSPR